MNPGLDRSELGARLRKLAPHQHIVERLLAAFSVAIALADDALTVEMVQRLRTEGVPRPATYEIMLQSYLLLGFPRMLSAAEALHRVWPSVGDDSEPAGVDPRDCVNWFEAGQKLCRRIYAENYEKLMRRVTAMSSEIFDWMILEGYGKVYSRPGADPVTRELANVSVLVVENREQQLHSHMRGALHVGASISLLSGIIEDLGPPAGDGYRSAARLLSNLRGR